MLVVIIMILAIEINYVIVIVAYINEIVASID